MESETIIHKGDSEGNYIRESRSTPGWLVVVCGGYLMGSYMHSSDAISRFLQCSGEDMDADTEKRIEEEWG